MKHYGNLSAPDTAERPEWQSAMEKVKRMHGIGYCLNNFGLTTLNEQKTGKMYQSHTVPRPVFPPRPLEIRRWCSGIQACKTYHVSIYFQNAATVVHHGTSTNHAVANTAISWCCPASSAQSSLWPPAALNARIMHGKVDTGKSVTVLPVDLESQ